jgi:hypothetical protein
MVRFKHARTYTQRQGTATPCDRVNMTLTCLSTHYTVCVLTLCHKFRISFLTSNEVKKSHQYGSDLRQLQIHGTLKFVLVSDLEQGERQLCESVMKSVAGRTWLRTWHLSCAGKGKVFTLQAWTGPWGSGRLRLPDFSWLSALWRW